MPPFDRDLIDPPSDELERTMVEAVQTANKRCRVGKMDPDRGEYRPWIAAEYARKPEGVILWYPGGAQPATFPDDVRVTLLGLAWWTNPLGRRLVRIVGRRLEPMNELHSHRFGPPGDRWPPLCYIAPERVCLRTRPGRDPELLAFCACGAVGSPAALGWTGTRCGPCHDHLEEHGTPLPGGDGVATFHAAGAVTGVGFSPSGGKVIAAVRDVQFTTDGKVCFWDRASGKAEHVLDHSFLYGLDTPFAVGDGRVIADSQYGRCSVWDSETGKVLREDRAGGCTSLVLVPDGRTVVGMKQSGSIQSLDLGAKTSWGRCRFADPEEEVVAGIAFSPGGKTLARGLDEARVQLLDWESGRGRVLTPGPADRKACEDQGVQTLAFSPDGKLLAAGTGPAPLDSDTEFQPRRRGDHFVCLYDVGSGKLLARSFGQKGEVRAVAFTPDGRWVVSGGEDRRLRFWDMNDRLETILDGHIGAVNALAFSADGATLASAGSDGTVRLWPWRALLDATPTAKRGKR